MRTSHTPHGQCRKCGHPFHAATDPLGEHVPSEGNISVCVECGELSVFNADRTLREPTPEEARYASLQPKIIALQLFIRGRRKDEGLH